MTRTERSNVSAAVVVGKRAGESNYSVRTYWLKIFSAQLSTTFTLILSLSLFSFCLNVSNFFRASTKQKLVIVDLETQGRSVDFAAKTLRA